MEIPALAAIMIVPALLADPAQSGADMLRQFGPSATLRLMASVPAPTGQLGTDDHGVRTAGASGRAEHRRLPAAPVAASGRRYVNTGGTGRNRDALAAPRGSVSGAAGDLQYVQAAGGDIAVYSKDTARLLLGPTRVNAIFYDAPPDPAMNACRTHAAHDATILYDQLANRWVVSYRAASGDRIAAANYQCIAVSSTADAQGSYYRYAITFTSNAGAPLHADDAKLALWPDAYYFSFSLFDSASGQYGGPRVCALARRALAAGADAQLRCRDLGSSAGPVAPAHMEGYAAPDGNAPAFFIALDHAASALLAWRFSWSTGVLSKPRSIAVEPFLATQAAILQPHPGFALQAMADRIAPRVVYRNHDGRETIVANHTVQIAEGQTSVRWYEIGNPLADPTLIDQGTLGSDSDSRFMGSIGVDKVGNIAVGYSVAAADTPPGIRYTGRETGDAPGLMQAEEIIVNGTGVQSGQPSTARSTGALALDPIDGCTFWYTQRYVPMTGSRTWRTRIANFRFRSCH